MADVHTLVSEDMLVEGRTIKMTFPQMPQAQCQK